MKQGLRTIGFMVLMATVFGAGVTGIRLATRETLKRNKSLAYQRAVVNVFQLANGVADPDFAKLFASQIDERTVTDPNTGQKITCYTAYADAAKEDPIAVGFQFVGRGFWGPISGILALSTDRQETLGLVILEQQETPGLGGRVAEPEFCGQFLNGVLVSPVPKGKCIRFSSTRPAADAPGAARHVDTITGATQTSMAMDRILNQALEAYARACQETAKAEEKT
jgi:Na+-transporting NADH:ubiquinone oxidoreductase subunit C